MIVKVVLIFFIDFLTFYVYLGERGCHLHREVASSYIFFGMSDWLVVVGIIFF